MYGSNALLKILGIPTLSVSSSYENYTLVCISTGGPVTSITWAKENTSIPSSSSTYLQSQMIVNISDATYHNVLIINSSDVRDYSGTYRCIVRNSMGNSTEPLSINGESFNHLVVSITGNLKSKLLSH